MLRTIRGRRRLLQWTTAGGLALVTPVFARDAKKKTEETISPTEELMREHAVLERIMLIYERGLRRLSEGEDIDLAVFAQSAAVVRDFIHDYHEKSEEELVFPHFKTAGRMVELVTVLASQHSAGRKLTERIQATAAQARSREPRQAMGRDIEAFVTLYRPHTAREETDLFPTLRQLVTGDDYDAIAKEMEKRERQAFGADGFEKIAKKVAEIETVLGIHDLDLFTPKT